MFIWFLLFCFNPFHTIQICFPSVLLINLEERLVIARLCSSCFFKYLEFGHNWNDCLSDKWRCSFLLLHFGLVLTITLALVAYYTFRNYEYLSVIFSRCFLIANRAWFSFPIFRLEINFLSFLICKILVQFLCKLFNWLLCQVIQSCFF